MNSSLANTDYFVSCLLGRRSPNPLYDPVVWPKAVSCIDRLTELSVVKKPLVRTYQSARYPKVYDECRGEERKAYSSRKKLHDSYGWLKFGKLNWAGNDRFRLFEMHSGLSNWDVTDTLIFCGVASKYLNHRVLPDVVISYCNYWRDANHFPSRRNNISFAFDQSFTLVIHADLMQLQSDYIRQNLNEIAGLLSAIDGVEFYRQWHIQDFPHSRMRGLGGVTNCDILSGDIVFNLWQEPIQLHPAFEALPHTRLSF